MKKTKILVCVIIGLVCGYSAVWYTEAKAIKSELVATITKLNEQDGHAWNIDYADIQVCGFPFSVAAKIRNPSIENLGPRHPVQVNHFHGSEFPAFSWKQEGSVTVGKAVLGNKYWIETAGTYELSLDEDAEPVKIQIPVRLNIVTTENASLTDLSVESLLEDFSQVHLKLDQGFVDESMSLDGFELKIDKDSANVDKTRYHYWLNLENLEFMPLARDKTYDSFEEVIAAASSVRSAPDGLGAINLEYEGEILLPSRQTFAEAKNLFETADLVGALKKVLQSESRFTVHQKKFSDAFVESRGGYFECGVRQLADQKCSIYVKGNEESKADVPAVIDHLQKRYNYLLEHGKDTPTMSNEMEKLKTLIFANPEALAPANLEGYLPESSGIKAEYRLDLDLSHDTPLLKEVHNMIELDLPSFERNIFLEGNVAFKNGFDVNNPSYDGIEPEADIRITNYAPMVETCFHAWNYFTTLWAAVDPSAAEEILPQEALDATLFLLNELNENKGEEAGDLFINIDFTDPQRPKIGAIPFDQFENTLAMAASLMRPQPTE